MKATSPKESTIVSVSAETFLSCLTPAHEHNVIPPPGDLMICSPTLVVYDKFGEQAIYRFSLKLVSLYAVSTMF